MILLILAGGMKGLAAVPQPENGFWVIITNNSGPVNTTVKFYDLQQHLIHEEKLEGVRLDANSKKTCRMLNKILQQSLVAWVHR
jgi:hypothetical protein